MIPKVQITKHHTNAAVQAVLDRYISAGIMSAHSATAVRDAAMPLASNAIKDLRQSGWTGTEITDYLAEKVATAHAPLRRLAAEIYVAAWEGMQIDFREQFGRELGD